MRGALLRGLLVGLAATVAVASWPRLDAREEISPATALEVQGWADAVQNHSAGRSDDGARWIASLTPERRAELRNGLGLFRDALSTKDVRVGNAAEKRIADLGAGIGRTPGLAEFVRRALVLHSDVAIAALAQPPAASPLPATPPTVAAGSSSQMQLLERDGEVVGVALKDWNWSFARSLLQWRDWRDDGPWLATWFHVTAQFLMSKRQYGEAQTQLIASQPLAPKDPRLLFDRGCYAELQGLPESQSLLSKEDLAALRAGRSWVGGAGLAKTSAATSIVGVRPKEVENADAERYFKQALDADPALLEAMVRLARLVDERGRHDEADELLRKAMAGDGSPDPVVRFYSHLFAGRVDRERGQLDSASTHFQAALKLYPGAQSARLAASQIAVLRSDVPAALDWLRPLSSRQDDTDLSEDPWWFYSRGLGRYATRLLEEFWTAERAR